MIEFENEISPAKINSSLEFLIGNISKILAKVDGLEKKVREQSNEIVALKKILKYTKAIEVNPNYAKAYYNRGATYGYLKNYEQAISDFSQAIKLNPNLYQAYGNRGIAYKNLKNYNQAISDFSQVIKLNPNDSNAYFYLGQCYKKLGEN